MLLSLASYAENVEAILAQYRRAAAGEIRLSDILTGFSDIEVVPENEQALEMLLNNEDGTGGAAVVEEEEAGEEGAEGSAEGGDGDGESALDSGPDPELCRQRFEELEALLQKARDARKKHGGKHKTTVKSFDELAEYLKNF